MSKVTLELKKATVAGLDAVSTGYVGVAAGSDGKVYYKDGSSSAVMIADASEIDEAVRIPVAVSSITYNADGTVNVLTRTDGWAFTHSYSSGLLSSIVQTKTGQPTTTTTITRNGSGQITSYTVVTA